MTQQHTVTLLPLGETITAEHGADLSDVLHDLGVEYPCGGRGLCGNCKVRLLAGAIALTPEHAAMLSRKGLSEEWRFACLGRVEEDITIEVAQFENIVLADETPFAFEARPGFGIAVDLGSTTVVSQLLDLQTGHVLAVQTDINPQARHGADIMSRISFAMESAAQFESLTTLVRQTIGRQIAALLTHTSGPIERIRIVGNSVMHHLFCGLDVSPLATYPFESPHGGMVHFSASELGWIPAGDNTASTDHPLVQTDITFLPNIGGFVGSDILAGIYAAGMFTHHTPRVLVDLGTNGEIAVSHGGQICCASTAAGPAFEGSNISCGMRASTGAISSLALNSDAKPNPDTPTQPIAHVIGNVPAKGICGSGLIDAICWGVSQGLVAPDGVIRTSDQTLPLTDAVHLTQNDIREFQLAKAAVATGIELLLRSAELTHAQVEKMFIAGGFGNYIQLPNAIGVGLLEFSEASIVKLSNSALIGAKMFLFQEDDFIDSLLPQLTHVSLESAPAFLDVFCEKISF